MHAADTETLGMLRESARDFCTAMSLQSNAEPRPGWWQEVAGLGWLAVAAPEARAGAGLGLLGAGVVAHELGRAGYTRGYADTVAIGHALWQAREAGRLGGGAWLDQALQDGLTGRAQLALVQDLGPHAKDESLIADVGAERLLLLDFDERSGLSLHVVGAGARQLLARSTSRARDLLLQARSGATLGDDGVRHVLASAADAEATWRDACHHQRILAAAQWVGVVRTALDIALEYARVRSQFGHVIGSYQAVQHAVVDILATCDAAELLVERALTAIDAGRADRVSLVDAATAYARETAWSALMRTYDVLGGVGFIEVHPINRYTRALMLSLAGAGSASACDDAAAQHVQPGHWLIA